MVAAARIGWIEVGHLSVRSSGVSTGTSQCQIVDCSGCLSVGLVCGQGSGREKGRGIRPRDPWFVLVSLLVSVDNQK
jgi:hypothetical protein